MRHLGESEQPSSPRRCTDKDGSTSCRAVGQRRRDTQHVERRLRVLCSSSDPVEAKLHRTTRRALRGIATSPKRRCALADGTDGLNRSRCCADSRLPRCCGAADLVDEAAAHDRGGDRAVRAEGQRRGSCTEARALLNDRGRRMTRRGPQDGGPRSSLSASSGDYPPDGPPSAYATSGAASASRPTASTTSVRCSAGDLVHRVPPSEVIEFRSITLGEGANRAATIRQRTANRRSDSERKAGRSNTPRILGAISAPSPRRRAREHRLEAAHAAVSCDIRRSDDDHVPGCTPRPSESEEVATLQALLLPAVEDWPILVRAAGERCPEPIVPEDGPADVAGDRDPRRRGRSPTPCATSRGRASPGSRASGRGRAGKACRSPRRRNATHDRDREHARHRRVSVRREPPGASGLTARPRSRCVRCTCSRFSCTKPSSVRPATARWPTRTAGSMCQYWNLRPLPQSTVTRSPRARTTVPEETEKTGEPSGAEMSSPDGRRRCRRPRARSPPSVARRRRSGVAEPTANRCARLKGFTGQPYAPTQPAPT